MEELKKLYEYIKEYGFYSVNKILYELEISPSVYPKETEILVCICRVLKKPEKGLYKTLRALLKKTNPKTIKYALDVLHLLHTTKDRKLISSCLSSIYDKKIKEYLFSQIAEKIDRKFGEKMRYIHSVYEIEISKKEFFKDREYYYKKYGGIVTEVKMEGDKAKVKITKVSSPDFIVKVNNNSYKLFIFKNNLMIDFQEKYKEYDKLKYHKLCKNVIYHDNDGTLIKEGVYYPKSQKSVWLYKELLKSAEEV